MADAIERVFRDVIAVGIRFGVELEHVACGDVDFGAIESGFHEAARPAFFEGTAHLFQAIRRRRSREQEGIGEFAPEEVGFERNGHVVVAADDDVALGRAHFFGHFGIFAREIIVDDGGDIFAVCDAFDSRRGTRPAVASIEHAFVFDGGHFGAVADGDDDVIDVVARRLRSGERLDIARAKLLGLECEARRAEAADFAAFGADFRHARASGQFDASIFDMAFFGGREREFAQFFERDHFDRFRTAFERRQRAVDCNCATAHDDDVAAELRLRRQKGVAIERVFFARNPEFIGTMNALCHENGIVFVEQRHGIVDFRARFDLDFEPFDEPIDIAGEHVFGESFIGDEVERTAQAIVAVVNRHVESALREHRRRTQASRATADDANRFAAFRRTAHFRHHAQLLGARNDIGLHLGDLDGRTVERLVRASALAIRIGANQTANAADRVRQQNLSRRALYIAIGATSGRHNKIGRRAINRAPLLTGLVFAILAAVRLT